MVSRPCISQNDLQLSLPAIKSKVDSDSYATDCTGDFQSKQIQSTAMTEIPFRSESFCKLHAKTDRYEQYSELAE